MRVDADWAAEHGGPTARHIADAHNALVDKVEELFDALNHGVDALNHGASDEAPYAVDLPNDNDGLGYAAAKWREANPSLASLQRVVTPARADKVVGLGAVLEPDSFADKAAK